MGDKKENCCIKLVFLNEIELDKNKRMKKKFKPGIKVKREREIKKKGFHKNNGRRRRRQVSHT